jgi:hypothetical protein
MGIEVGIWSGDIVDPRGVTFRGEGSDVVAPEMYEDETYPLLSGIDPYGDTIFNSLQMPRLIKELERRFEAMDAGLKRRTVGRVLGFARECLDASPHTYLVFVGD